MGATFDLYWSFRSPYCYFSMDRLFALPQTLDVTLRLRHVWPGAMRRSGYFDRLHANYGAYHALDSQRTADYLKIPYARPVPDPLVFDLKSREPIADQPYIRNLTRLALAARSFDKELEFVSALMRLMWDGRVQGWDKGPHLEDMTRHQGLDLGALQDIAEKKASEFDAEVETNGGLLEAAGHWGVPCAVVDGEPFFGQDRIDMLGWRLAQKERPS